MKVNPTERALQAKELFLEGYNCAQSVFLAYADIVGMEPELAATISAPFGGGMGRLREVCGAVSGMTMVAGMLYPNSQPNDTPRKKATYAAVQGLATQKDDPTPSERTEEYYHRRPCAEYVEIAARIVGEKINSMED